MLAPAIMVQGTASSVGKSLLVAALCRLFRRDGVDVAPFKSQNMALNSAVTPDGLEIGRAQAVQAEAAGLMPCVEMNPILLKPEGHQRSQVVLLGRPALSMSAREYHAYKPELAAVVANALETLRRRHELIIIEGAGSPAEINLKDRDIVNMHVARLADAPVLLTGDIDRGGVFAAFVGTLELLEPDERDRVAAFIVNKFRGDLALLEPGLEFLRRRTGKPVLGVVPHVPELRIADEDSLSLSSRDGRRRAGPSELEIVVVGLPHISNYDDVSALEHEAQVVVRFVRSADDWGAPDLVILPGTKNTLADLGWLRARGFADAILRHAEHGGRVLGICGGCQMLGRSIEDPLGVEGEPGSALGLGLLPIETRFGRDKRTTVVQARALAPSFVTAGALEASFSAYEIHMGRIQVDEGAASPFELLHRNGDATRLAEGAVNGTRNVVGTMLHGLFEDDVLRASLLASLRQRRGLEAPQGRKVASPLAEYDRLEAVVRSSLDLGLLRRLARVAAPGTAT